MRGRLLSWFLRRMRSAWRECRRLERQTRIAADRRLWIAGSTIGLHVYCRKNEDYIGTIADAPWPLLVVSVVFVVVVTRSERVVRHRPHAQPIHAHRSRPQNRRRQSRRSRRRCAHENWCMRSADRRILPDGHQLLSARLPRWLNSDRAWKRMFAGSWCRHKSSPLHLTQYVRSWCETLSTSSCHTSPNRWLAVAYRLPRSRRSSWSQHC